MKTIAKELVTTIQKSATIDWTLKESVRASMRSKIKRLLAKFRYLPDKQEAAVKLVIEQAELIANEETRCQPANLRRCIENLALVCTDQASTFGSKFS